MTYVNFINFSSLVDLSVRGILYQVIYFKTDKRPESAINVPRN